MSVKRAFFSIFQKIMVFCCAIFFGFANAFAANLPSGYTELEYVTFNATQSLDTGFTPNQNSEIRIKYSTNTIDSWIYGTGSSNPRITLYSSNAGNQRFGNVYVPSVNIYGSRGAIHTDIQNKSGLNHDGTLLNYNGSVGTFTAERTLTMGVSHGDTGVHKFDGNVYYLQIYDNGVMVRNYVPVKKGSQIGLYDTVNGGFLTDSNLVAGPVVRAPLPNEYQAITPDNIETYPETLSGYTLVKSSNSTNWDAVSGVNGGTGYYRFDLGPGDIIASDTKRISNFGPQVGISSSNSVVGFAVYKSSSNQRNYIAVRDPSKFTSVSALGTYFASNPLMVLYKNTTATNNEFVAVSRRSDNVFGYYCVSGTNQGDFVLAYGMTGSVAIKIATTAYNTARFSPVMTDLNTTVATIRSVVTNTINQTKAIADLQATKQTRPEEQCPAGKKCLLVETEENGVIVPHWFPIIEAPEE